MSNAATVRGRAGPDNRIASVLRLTVELIAWVGAPWALWRHSAVLAVASVVVLIGLPAVFATPGDKRTALVPVPGMVTIGLVVLQMVAAVWAAWAIWDVPVAVVVTLLTVASLVAERARWRWLASADR